MARSFFQYPPFHRRYLHWELLLHLQSQARGKAVQRRSRFPGIATGGTICSPGRSRYPTARQRVTSATPSHAAPYAIPRGKSDRGRDQLRNRRHAGIDPEFRREQRSPRTLCVARFDLFDSSISRTGRIDLPQSRFEKAFRSVRRPAMHDVQPKPPLGRLPMNHDLPDAEAALTGVDDARWR
jgi:hypothetical protein